MDAKERRAVRLEIVLAMLSDDPVLQEQVRVYLK